jgi:hypothetical protein
MAEDWLASRALDAVNAYVAEVDTAELVRAAYLAGMRRGLELAGELSTQCTGTNGLPKGLIDLPPLEPPFQLRDKQILTLLPDPDPDPEKSNGHAKKRVPFPADFRLTEERRTYAEAGGLNAKLEWAKFHDHARIHNRKCADWPAAWRNWCRYSDDFPRVGRR